MDGAATQHRARGFRILATLLVLVVTAAVCAGALAQWSAASTALPRGAFASGSLAVAGGSAVLGAKGLTPGETVTGSVIVTNDGSAPGRFTLFTSRLVDVPGAAGGSLARTLRLTVTDVTTAGFPQRLYDDGSLAGLSGVDLGTFGPGAVRAYRFAVTFPQQAVGGAAYAGSILTVAFDWTAVTTG